MFRRKFIDRLRNKYNQGNSLSFEGGGWKDKLQLGLEATRPFLTGAIKRATGPVNLLLGSQTAYAKPVIDATTGVNRFTGNQDYTPFGQTPSWGGGSGNVNVADVNQQLSASMAPKINQTGGMYNQMQQYQEGGKYPHDMYNKKTGYKIVAEDAEAHSALSKDFDHNKMMGGGMYDQMQQYQMGGQQLPGGTMEPIPNSDAVVFKGATHDQGGIYPDPQTEVEGGGFSADGTPLEGETMDKVTMAKKGGLKDYFFSDHLKEGGMSYADMHKEILAEGGDQSKIDWLAQMQEKAAGRSPNKIQTASSGGARKYNNGGYTTDTSNQVNDNMLAHRYQIIQDIEDGKPIYNEISNNEFVNPSDLNDMGNPDLFLNNFFKNKEDQRIIEKEKEEEKENNNKTIVKKKKAVVVKKNPPKREEESLIKIPMRQVASDWNDPWEDGEPIGTGLSEAEIEEIINTKGSEKDKTLLDRLKEQARRGDIPLEAYIAGITQLLPAAYSYLHKQPDAEQAGYTAGFTSPIVAERGKGAKLDRVNFNVERAANASDMRGINRFIETSGGGPANIINKMMAYSRKQQGDAKINAAETRANMQIANQEAQLQQQMELNNMQRAQQASMTNAQLIRAEAARMDQIDANNAAARQKIKDDEEFQKYAGIGATASGIAGLAGDSLSYKASERMARAIGTEGIYDRDQLRDVVTRYAAKNGIPGICPEPGTCTEKQINAYITSQNKTEEEETKDKE
tara:strand:+ start:12016 stop:14226 length:2211 start_codon:yes stop_codon:yes gene_type:complete